MFENTYQDIELTCSDCGCKFIFSSEEQEFYAEKGFATPKRCAACRTNRKKQRSGGGGFAKKRYNITCSKCGCETTVPFKPREDKEVYCSDCYASMKDDSHQTAQSEY
ncbi:MAG: zinc-ribbon domain containing protein [Candidatus Gastranaerophilales bacterium]|nr:zinc-ribbon domain containing protein [Candidatus Gastranaerophilales bacterium]